MTHVRTAEAVTPVRGISVIKLFYVPSYAASMPAWFGPPGSRLQWRKGTESPPSSSSVARIRRWEDVRSLHTTPLPFV